MLNGIHQTHLHGSIRGLVHTGSGDISVRTFQVAVKDLHFHVEDAYGLGRPKTFLVEKRINHGQVLQCVASYLQRQAYAPSSLKQLAGIEKVEIAYHPWWFIECEVAIQYEGVHKKTRSVRGADGEVHREEYEERTGPHFHQVSHPWPIYAGKVPSVELANLFKRGALRIVYDWGDFVFVKLRKLISTLSEALEGRGSSLGPDNSAFKPYLSPRFPFFSIAPSGIPVTEDPTFLSRAEEVTDWTKVGQIGKTLISSSPQFAVKKARIDIRTFYWAQFRSKFHRLERFDADINPLSIALVCMPLWKVTLKYRDRLYNIWIDGHNGEIAKAEIPVGDIRKAIECLMVAAVFGCIMLVNVSPFLMTGTPLWSRSLDDLVVLAFGLIAILWGTPFAVCSLSAIWYVYQAWKDSRVSS